MATTNRPLTAPPRSAICSALLRLERAALALRMFERTATYTPTMPATPAQSDAQEADRAVLSPQERFGPFLDRVGDLAHLGCSGVLPQHVASQTPGDDQGEDREPQDESNEHSEL